MTQPETLPLACPFCHGPAWQASSMFPDATEWQLKHLIVRCADDKCPGFTCETNLEKWNNRSPDKPEAEAPSSELPHILTAEQSERVLGFPIKGCWKCGGLSEVDMSSTCARCVDDLCWGHNLWIPVMAWNKRADPAFPSPLPSDKLTGLVRKWEAEHRDMRESGGYLREDIDNLGNRIAELKEALLSQEPSLGEAPRK